MKASTKATKPALPVVEKPALPVATKPALPVAPLVWYGSNVTGQVEDHEFEGANMMKIGSADWAPYTQGAPTKAPGKQLKAAKAADNKPKVAFDGVKLFSFLKGFDENGATLKRTSGGNQAVTAFCADGTVITVVNTN